MSLRDKLTNNQYPEIQKEVFDAFEKLPEGTITPNDIRTEATKMIPTNGFYIGLGYKNQLKIPSEAKIIRSQENESITFEYNKTKYFVCFSLE